MEDLNFTRDLGGRSLPGQWGTADGPLPSDEVLRSADDDPPESLYRSSSDAVERSRARLREALGTDAGLGATYRTGSGRPATVRRLLVDMIEEYGRHTGQADLLREAVDGRTGEDPPGSAVELQLPW
ncbi:hypothetical protein GCM10028777_16190 [Angustibacter speluncae]